MLGQFHRLFIWLQDKAVIDSNVRKSIPPLKTASELEYGFKIR
jgi:hypothetical protein